MSSGFKSLPLLLLTFLSACQKDDRTYDEGGGQLPGQYFIINNRSISPNTISLSSGNNLIFLNRSNENHHLISQDSTINTGPIVPGGYHMWTGDNDGLFMVKCVFHPEETANINLLP
jgi:hypothetical protein